MTPATSKLSSPEIQQQLATVQHWYHRIEVAPGITTPGVHDSPSALKLLQLPNDCRGLRALDIGARDGFFSFELEKRGAKVLAIDYVPETQTGFAVARNLLGSQVQFELANVYDLQPDRYGTFDLVLFLGVLYHLRNPLLALDRVRSVCKDRMWLESYVIDHSVLDPSTGKFRELREFAPGLVSSPIMQFYPREELNKDFTNWWGPNMACLKGLAEAAGFSIERELLHGERGLLQCRAKDDVRLNYFRDIESSVVPG